MQVTTCDLLTRCRLQRYDNHTWQQHIVVIQWQIIFTTCTHSIRPIIHITTHPVCCFLALKSPSSLKTLYIFTKHARHTVFGTSIVIHDFMYEVLGILYHKRSQFFCLVTYIWGGQDSFCIRQFNHFTFPWTMKLCLHNQKSQESKDKKCVAPIKNKQRGISDIHTTLSRYNSKYSQRLSRFTYYHMDNCWPFGSEFRQPITGWSAGL